MRMRLTILITILTGMSLAELRAQQPGEQELREKISKAWQEREDKVKSAKLVWRETETVPRGAESAYSPELYKGHGVVPLADDTSTTRFSFLIQGECANYAYSSRSWDSEQKKMVSSPYQCAYCEEVEESIISKNDAIGRVIHRIKAKKHKNLDDPQLRAVVYAIRGGASKLAPWSLEQFEYRGERKTKDFSCYVFQRQSDSSTREFLIDRDTLLLRREIVRNNKFTLMQIDIQYDSQPTPMPWKWNIHVCNRNNGGTYYTSRSEIEKSEFNQIYTSDAFRIERTPGAEIIDRITNKRHLASTPVAPVGLTTTSLFAVVIAVLLLCVVCLLMYVRFFSSRSSGT